MTPKEKAQELVERFSEHSYVFHTLDTTTSMTSAKQCALIAVDEIMKSEPRYPSDVDWDDCGGTHQYYYEAQREDAEKYWQEVKQEIEKLYIDNDLNCEYSGLPSPKSYE